MRCLRKNMQTLYYKNLISYDAYINQDGYYDGSLDLQYGEPVKFKANVSGNLAGTGRAADDATIEPYGQPLDYDKTIVTDILDLPINYSTVYIIDNEQYRTSSINKTLNILRIRVKHI